MTISEKQKALVIGATGATGKCVVAQLLEDTAFERVIVFVRRPTRLNHPKLVEHVIDFSRLDDHAKEIVGEVLFCCLGTTRKLAGSAEAQREVDLELQARFAALARRNMVSTCVLVSSSGASARSRLAYPQMKGELEERVSSMGFERFVIFRPGPLERPGSDRPAEKLGVSVIRGMNRLGLGKRFRPLPVQLLAQKLVKAAKSAALGRTVVALDQIFTY